MECFFLGRTTGHGTTWIQDIPFQCDQFILMAIFFCQLYCFIQIFHHNDAAQQIQCDLSEFFIKGHQIVGCANDANFSHDSILTFQRSAFDGSDWQECRTAQIVAFQIVDGILRVLFCFCNYILQCAAQCRFNGCFIGFFHFQQLTDSTTDASFRSILQIQQTFYTIVKTFMLFFHFHQQRQTGTCFGNAFFLLRKAGFCSLFLLCRMFSIVFERIQFLFQITDMFFSIAFLFFQCLQMDTKLMQTTFCIFHFLFQLFFSGKELSFHSFSFGNFTFRFCADTDLFENLILKGFRFIFALCQRIIQGSIFPLQCIQFALFLVHFQFQSISSARAGCLFRCIFLLLSGFFSHFLLNTADVCRIIGALFFPQTDFPFGLFHLAAQFHHFVILLLQESIQFFCFYTQGVRLLFFSITFRSTFRQLFFRSDFILLQFFQLRTDAFRILTESRCFCLFQMFFQSQIFLRLFTLFCQRAYLHFQFTDDVIHTKQILLFFFQFMNSLVFSGFIFHDACRFFENTAAVITFCAQNLINTALSDDGISFSANACIHEQFLNILQSAGSTIDTVFTFTGAEHPSGHLHFTVIQRQFTVLIIDQNGNFRKAQCLSIFRTGKDDILHLIAAQTFCTLFPQYPANSIGNITLAAAIWANDCRHTGIEFQFYFFRKGFETL